MQKSCWRYSSLQYLAVVQSLVFIKLIFHRNTLNQSTGISSTGRHELSASPFLAGSPTVTDPLNPQRWDYIYNYIPGTYAKKQKYQPLMVNI